MRQTRILYAALHFSGLLCQTSALDLPPLRWLSGRSTTSRAVAGTLVNVSLAAPANAEAFVPTHISFSIEQDRWPEWVGVDRPNQFTTNALVNLQQITGQPPKIRVGANSEDHTVWSPTVTINEDIFPPFSSITPFPEARNITVGDGFYQLSKFLPRGTHMTWGVNFGFNNITNAVNMAKSIMRAFATREVKNAGVHLDFIELGNEADLFQFNGARPRGFTQQQYVANWINVADPVARAAGLLDPGATVALQGASFAGQGYTVAGIFQDGILNSVPGKVIKQISQHRYSAAFCSGGNFALSSFMSKTAVRGNLTVFNSDIAVTRAKGLPYVLGETNSIACHGAPGVSNTAGAALWVIDYTLQAATLGMVETYFHEGIGFKYNFIQPISLNRSILDGSPVSPPTPAHVQPAYYAAILVAHAIGKSGTARIVELAVPHPTVSGYAVYESDGGGGKTRLARAVFVNLDAWLAGAQGARPRVHVDLAFVGAGQDLGSTTARVRRLAIGHADDVAGVTFAGLSYETSNALVQGKETHETVRVKNGVDIAATEAILISFAK